MQHRHPINGGTCGGPTHSAGTDVDWIYSYRSVSPNQKINWDEDTLGEAIGRELYSTYGKVYEDFRSGYGEDKDLNDLNIDIEVEAKQLMYS